LDQFFAVQSSFLGSYHDRQLVAVAVRLNGAKKPDWTGPLNTMYFMSNTLPTGEINSKSSDGVLIHQSSCRAMATIMECISLP
jgi:hypothetical protein